ncbi:MAG: DNA repair exonuclease [Tissierellia bacterium]|nr:DNA repair exonuclease [Tissierellia bacterium]
MIRFIHTGDLHLGLQFNNVSFDVDKANERRLELWHTFSDIVEKAAVEEVDFLFIAGDLFEEKYFTLKDMKRVRDILKKAGKTQVIITAGNHDTLNIKSLYKIVEWPENITIFSSTSLDRKDFPEKNTSIYGYSWDKSENNNDIFKGFQGLDDDRINILVIHGDIFNQESPYLPLDRDYIDRLGFDYVALGHIHKPQIISPKMAYCGSPEPLDFGELGEHGIILGRIENRETDIKFLPFSRRKFLKKTVKVDNSMGYIDILDRIKECDQKEELKNNFYRITLEGIVNRYVDINIEDMLKDLEGYFYYLELVDKTVIDYDLDELEEDNKDNLIGYFIREMKKKDLKDRINRDALYLGLEALLKGKVDL